MWDYVYFFSYILSKRQIDLTTIQAEAYDNVLQFRNDWLPYQKSLYLKKLNLDQEEVDGVEALGLKVSKLMETQEEMKVKQDTILEKLEQLLATNSPKD